MASIDFKETFTDDFDLETWDPQDVDDAFNPFGQTAKAFTLGDEAESTERTPASEKSASRHHRPRQNEHSGHIDRRAGSTKQSSFKRRSNVRESHPTESNQNPAGSARSHRPSSSADNHDIVSNRGNTADRRTRVARIPATAVSKPVRQRSLPGNQKSMRNLVSLLHSSMDSFGDELFDSDKVSSAVSTSTGGSGHDEKVSEESRDMDKARQDCGNGNNAPSGSIERTPSARSRRASKDYLVDEVTHLSIPEAADHPSKTPSKVSEESRGMDKARPVRGNGNNAPSGGIERTPSARSRRASKDYLVDEVTHLSIPEAADHPSKTPSKVSEESRGMDKARPVRGNGNNAPSGGIERTPSARSRRASKDYLVDEVTHLSIPEAADHPSYPPSRGIQKARSLRARHSGKADHVQEVHEGPDSRHIRDKLLASPAAGDGAMKRSHSVKSRRNARSSSVDNVDLAQADGHSISAHRTATGECSQQSSKTPSRTLSGKSRTVRRCKSSEQTVAELAAALIPSKPSTDASAVALGATFSSETEPERGRVSGSTPGHRNPPTASKSGQGLQRMPRSQRMP
jgi:hypothetical protein